MDSHAKFRGIGKAEVTKRVRGIHHEKKVGILPLSLWLLERSRAKFYRIILSPYPISLPSFVQLQIRAVFEEIYPKMSSKLIAISA